MKLTRFALPLIAAASFLVNAPAMAYGNYYVLHGLYEGAKYAGSSNRESNQSVTQRVDPASLRQAGKCPDNYPLGIPVVVSAQRDKIERRSFYLCRIGYAVQFDPATKTPLWSAEALNGQALQGAHEPRTNDFQPDPEVPFPAQATLKDYVHTKFDRGHMSPAADMSGRPDGAMSQSFYLTNMVPQVGPNQNRGIWADLEAQVRQWAMARGQVLVTTGPIFDQGYQTMGRSNVWIPTRLYKVVIDPRTLESIAFIIPNRQIVTYKTHEIDPGNPEYPQTQGALNCNGQACSAANFAVPVSAVEQATGLRFFTRLNDQTHNQVVSQIGRGWTFSR